MSKPITPSPTTPTFPIPSIIAGHHPGEFDFTGDTTGKDPTQCSAVGLTRLSSKSSPKFKTSRPKSVTAQTTLSFRCAKNAIYRHFRQSFSLLCYFDNRHITCFRTGKIVAEVFDDEKIAFCPPYVAAPHLWMCDCRSRLSNGGHTTAF